MKHLGKKVFISVVVLALAAFLSGTAHAADEETITGTVTIDNQIKTADGTVFEVADTDTGAEVMDLIGQEVKVTGTIKEIDKRNFIDITDYEILH